MLLGKIKCNLLLGLIHWPPIVLLVLDEVKQEKNVSEINEAISLVRFLWLPVVHRHRQVVESSTVIHLEILFDVVS